MMLHNYTNMCNVHQFAAHGVRWIKDYGPLTVHPHPERAGFVVTDRDGFCWCFSVNEHELLVAVEKVEMELARNIMTQGTAVEGM